ncbi:surface antigen [Sinorhizobium medicae]|nr:surface antigen [Sinorhizobium medicae]TWA35383.1 surface antigen [Sinorhizobium medicae]TWA43496.1 surface antigen [Sinorhizobium medicae]
MRIMRNYAEMTRAFASSGRIAVVASSVALSGCGTTSSGQGGAVAGLGAASTRVVSSATYIEALQGGVVSRLAGVDLGKSDRQRALEAEYRALEAAPGGQPVAWQGRGVSGSVVAAAPYQVGSQNCRQYSHTVTVKGQQSTARGAACRNSDGSWTPLT